MYHVRLHVYYKKHCPDSRVSAGINNVLIINCVCCYRLMLAMDPKYGEISRAMRNRGVEINILGEVIINQSLFFSVQNLISGVKFGFKSPKSLMKVENVVHMSCTRTDNYQVN